MTTGTRPPGGLRMGTPRARWVLFACAVFLPYVAVVMANAATSKSDGFDLPDGRYDARELSSGTDPKDPPG